MSHHPPPHEVFSKILALFQGVGAVGRDLSIERQGCRYRVFCDENGFIVYRVVENHKAGRHLPGWPVLMVSHDHIYEEASLNCGYKDHLGGEPELEEWVELIRNRLGGRAH